MSVYLSVKMLYILVICPVVLAAGVQTLTIDSQLGTSIEDCFERISIGEQLPPDAIYRNVTELTTRECEQICKQDKQCQSYDYGVGAKGNATCNLSKLSLKEIREKNILIRHPDYDLYVRRFHCEQSPPSPIQPQLDEIENPSEKPLHRPVYRPAEEKLPINDEDFGYGAQRPEQDERPDDYSNSKPDNDSGPSYGAHKPQDVPFTSKPQKPIKKPSSIRPDPYDVLQLQDSIYPGNGNNRPQKIPYIPEKPQYIYITRPRPIFQQDIGVGNNPGYTKPSYDDPGYTNPSRPYDRPRPVTSNQYANGYGPNIPYDDNYIQVEIRDPPRPFDRPRPFYQGIYGYGTYSSQNSYSQDQSSLSQNYDSSGHWLRPSKPTRPVYADTPYPNNINQKPTNGAHGNKKPTYSDQASYDSYQDSYQSNYNSQASYGGSGSYGTSIKRPSRPNLYDDYNRPGQTGYGGSSGDRYGNNQNSYGSSHSSNKPLNDKPSQGSYGGSRPTYGYDDDPVSNNKPSYGNDESSHGSNQPLSDTNRPSYGEDEPSYGNNKPTQLNDKPTNTKPSKPSHNSDKPSYGNPVSSYENERPSYGNDDSSYGGNKPSYESDQPSYGGNKPGYADDQPSYGGSKPGYEDDQPSYGSNKPSHTNDQPAYGSNKPSLTNDQPSYGGSKPGYEDDQPSYGGSKPGYQDDQPSYGSKPSYQNDRPSYGNDEPSYGSNKPSYDDDRPSYGSNRPSYGSNKPSYANDQPSYGGNKPNYDDDRPSYGSNKPSFDDDRPSYGSNKPSYPDDEPSYGGNKPSYSNDRPSYGNLESSYGNNKPSQSNKRPLPSNDQPSYGNRPIYSTSKPLYIYDYPVYGSGTYGGQYYLISHTSHGSYNSQSSSQYQDSYGSSSHGGSYGGSQGSYENNQSGYGGQNDYNRPSGSNRPSSGYIDNDPVEGISPSYGSNRPLNDRPAKPQKPKPGYTENDDSNQGYGGASQKPGYDDNRPDYNNPNDMGLDDEAGYNIKTPNKTSIRPVYENEKDKPLNAPSYIARPGGEVVTSKPMVIGQFHHPDYFRIRGKPASYEACFRRVLAGKRTLRSHVRKVVDCERLEDCRRECAMERAFPCESFNYRLDRTFRGKGLCELMTKPIEAFDLVRDFVEDKDFDFFELDRNSLEPNCPDTLRGPGYLHSGYLSNKDNGVSEWTERDDWRNRDRNYSDRRSSNRKRYQDRLYIPYQINQGIARSDDEEPWGQYGGAYGGTNRYYKDKNDYQKSVHHWRLANDIELPYNGVKPYSNTKFDYNSLGKHSTGSFKYGDGTWKRGRWNNVENTNGLDIEESNFYKPKPHFHGVNERGHEPIARSDDEPPAKDCSSRRRPGMSLGTGAIRRALIAHNVVECESACFSEREFKCVSYSYRYSSAHGTDNCFLSERPYRGLEMSADSSSDVYAMPPDQGCVTINSKPWVETECFWHVRSGAAVTDSAVRAALTVGGLGACEAECIRAHAFFCRGFSFRYDSPTIGDDLENCILTSSPPTSLDSGRGLRSNSGHELYSRGNYGRGCEPALYDDTQHRDEECYLQYDKAAKLTGSAIRGQARVKDEQSCGHACNEAPFTCLSFSFTNNAPRNKDNCLLSEIRLFDLQRGVDYVHSTDDWLFAFDLFNGQCWRKVHSQHFDYSSEIPRPISAPPVEDPYSLTVPSGHPGVSGPSGPPGITGPSGPTGTGFTSTHHDQPYIPSGPPSGPNYKPNPHRHPTRPYHDYPEPSVPGHKPHYPPGSNHKPGYLDPSGPPFKPGYSDLPGPIYKPEYPETNFKPGYAVPSGPDFIPARPETSFRPGHTAPSGPDYIPEYTGPESNLKPSYYDSGRPSYKPVYTGPVVPNVRPGYPLDDGLNLRPGYPGLNNFKPGYPPPVKPDYPTGPPSPSYRPGYEPRPDSRPVYRPPEKPAYRPIEHDFIPGKPNYLPDRRPGYPGPNRPLLDELKPGRPVGRPGDPDRDIIEPITASWRHYTVSGFPCRSGTTCAQNQVAGHWACEPEGGEIGSWDYCCAPTHRCGYSEGFNKPWCFVGPSEDQWRPCSEKYYPYHQHNVPHPSQGNQQPSGQRGPWNRPSQPEVLPLFKDKPQGPQRLPFERPQGPYLSEEDRKYWDELYANGPKAYYDKHGNPLPGYSRIPTEERPHIKVSQNNPRPGTGEYHNIPQYPEDSPPPALGAPRYWPVAYLHKGPPPNTTYFRYNETEPEPEPIPTTTETNKYTTTQREQIYVTTPQPNNVEKHRDEKQRNMSVFEEVIPEVTTIKVLPTTTELPDIKVVKENKTEVEMIKPVNVQIKDLPKGIDDKIDDFAESIEVLDLDDVKGDKISDVKTLEAEERQIEEIGRILASRRGGKFVLDKRSQQDLESKSIAVDKELMDLNFGNKFSSERRGIIQRVTKEEIERERNADKSLEVSETTYVRPPRILPTTDNIRKTIVNGKIFYDATIREQREALMNTTRRSKNLRNADESRIPNLTSSANFGKKTVLTRNVNPVRRVRRVFRKRYNPDEVRRRLLEREKSKSDTRSDILRKSN